MLNFLDISLKSIHFKWQSKFLKRNFVQLTIFTNATILLDFFLQISVVSLKFHQNFSENINVFS